MYVSQIVKVAYTAQIRSAAADDGRGRGAGVVRLGDHLLQRHRGLHRHVRGVHAAASGQLS